LQRRQPHFVSSPTPTVGWSRCLELWHKTNAIALVYAVVAAAAAAAGGGGTVADAV